MSTGLSTAISTAISTGLLTGLLLGALTGGCGAACPAGQGCGDPPHAAPGLFILAGGTGSGYADGTNAEARFDGAYGLGRDRAGDLYVTETNNHTVRFVDYLSNSVVTIAGRGGESGSVDGVGEGARFNQPVAAIPDAIGNLFVFDSGNHTIRRVALVSNTVSTFVGLAQMMGSADGVGTGVRLGRIGIPDAGESHGGNVFFPDSSNHTIRVLNIDRREVLTLAGSAGTSGSADGTGGKARFNDPAAVALGGNFLYVADRGNHTIRKISLASGAVTTVAGSPGVADNADGTGAAARFNGPTGLHLISGALYIADSQNGLIRKFDPMSGQVTTVAGTPGQRGLVAGPLPGGFDTPIGLRGDADSLFVTDSAANAVVQVRGFQ